MPPEKWTLPAQAGPYDLQGVLGFDNLIASGAGGQNVEMLSWQPPHDLRRPVELELILYCTENDSLNVVPRTVLWKVVNLAHGAASHELRDQFNGSIQPFWALPANGVRLRFATRACKVLLTNTANAKRFRASLQPVQGCGAPQPLPDRAMPLPIFVGISAAAIPIGAREFRLHCVDPLQTVQLLGLDSAATIIEAQPASQWFDWTAIPIDAAFFTTTPAVGELVTGVFR